MYLFWLFDTKSKSRMYWSAWNCFGVTVLLSLTPIWASSGNILQILNRYHPLAPRVVDLVKTQVEANNHYNLTFIPESIEELLENEEQNVEFSMICPQNSQTLTILAEDEAIAEIPVNATIRIQCDATWDEYLDSFVVLGKRLGLTKLKLYLHDPDRDYTEEDLIYSDYEVIVLREERLVDEIYRYGIIVCASLIYLGFGCQIDLSWIWSIVKKPVAPAIGIFCQFFVMPMLGFGVAMLLQLDDEYAFGLLAMSCSPGGGGSNVYAHLLRGDLDLSITMTFFSTLLSLGFMPFWMFALGRFFIDETRIEIPYLTIVRSLLTIVLPLIIGLAIKRWLPKIAKYLVIATKPFSMFFILYMLTFGTYVNWYMFIIMGTVPQIIPAATMVPALGFGLGYLIAYIFKQGNKKSTTVSVETGYQNASIPIIMLQGNFQQPEGDLGAVMPVTTAFFMQIPLYIWYAAIEIGRRCCQQEAEDESMVKDLGKGAKGISISGDDEEAGGGDIQGDVQAPDIVKAYNKRDNKRNRQPETGNVSVISYSVQGRQQQEIQGDVVEAGVEVLEQVKSDTEES